MLYEGGWPVHWNKWCECAWPSLCRGFTCGTWRTVCWCASSREWLRVTTPSSPASGDSTKTSLPVAVKVCWFSMMVLCVCVCAWGGGGCLWRGTGKDQESPGGWGRGRVRVTLYTLSPPEWLPALWWAVMRAINISLIVRDKVKTRQHPQTTNFEEWGDPR